MKNIILCIDGEQATANAIGYAIEITRACNACLTALHVIDPYLKKFADEIYAVGRIEYKEHIDRELRKEAEEIIHKFTQAADSAGLSYEIVLRCGPPEEEIAKEVSEHDYDLLILGVNPKRTFSAKIRSFRLPEKIFRNIRVPTLFVP